MAEQTADRRRGGSVLQPQWHSWGSPVGMGIGLLCVGGFFALLALGLFLMASI